MALAGLGAAIAKTVTLLVNRRPQRDCNREWAGSLRVKQSNWRDRPPPDAGMANSSGHTANPKAGSCRWRQWHGPKRFRPPAEGAITVTLTAAEARTVHEAMLLAGAYLSAEIEGEKVAGQPPPLEDIGSLRALAAEIEAGQTSGR